MSGREAFSQSDVGLAVWAVLPWHEVILLLTCQCGTPLRLFDPQTLPFTCRACGRDWADLPRVSPTPERIAVTRQLLSCYEYFSFCGNPVLMERAFHAVVHAWREEIIRDRKLPHKRRDSQKAPIHVWRQIMLPLLVYWYSILSNTVSTMIPKLSSGGRKIGERNLAK